MFDALVEWMGYPMYFTGYGGTQPPRTGAQHAAIAPYGPYPTGDGHTVYLGIQNEREWGSFCGRVLQAPEVAADQRFSSNSRRVEHRDQLDALIVAAFADSSVSQIVEQLDAAGIANARMNSVRELLDHPQLVARHRWRDIPSPVGPVRALQPPIDISGVEAAMGPIPAVGEHTDSILREIGYEPGTIAKWRASGIV